MNIWYIPFEYIVIYRNSIYITINSQVEHPILILGAFALPCRSTPWAKSSLSCARRGRTLTNWINPSYIMLFLLNYRVTEKTRGFGWKPEVFCKSWQYPGFDSEPYKFVGFGFSGYTYNSMLYIYIYNRI